MLPKNAISIRSSGSEVTDDSLGNVSFPAGDRRENTSPASLSEEDVDSNGDVSPDLPDSVEWSTDVCREADKRICSRRSLSSTHRRMLRRGRSLERLLEACRIDDDDDFDGALSRGDTVVCLSRSLPRLPSFSLGSADSLCTSDESVTPHVSAVTLNSKFSGISCDTESEFSGHSSTEGLHLKSSTFETDENSETFARDVKMAKSASAISSRERSGADISENFEPSEAVTIRKKSSYASSDGMRHSTQNSKRPLRKRHTASDEMHLLQLQVARDEPSSDPAVSLKLYQVLSLGYMLHFTTSPYIREILNKKEVNCEAHNYRRSYTLESC
jgi:hypothetical protein